MTSEQFVVQPNSGDDLTKYVPALVQILLADDDILFLTLMRILLLADFPQAVVRSAEDGLAALEAHAHVRADVIIADYRMPMMNGIELVTYLRRQGDPVPIVIVSSEPNIDTNVLEAGATAFLTKARASSDLTPLLTRLLADQAI